LLNIFDNENASFDMIYIVSSIIKCDIFDKSKLPNSFLSTVKNTFLNDEKLIIFYWGGSVADTIFIVPTSIP